MAFEWAEKIADALFEKKEFDGDEEVHYVIRPAVLILLFAGIMAAFAFSWKVNAQTEEKVNERITYTQLKDEFAKERELSKSQQQQNAIKFQQLQNNFNQQQQIQQQLVESVGGMNRMLEFLLRRQDPGRFAALQPVAATVEAAPISDPIVDDLTQFYVTAFKNVLDRNLYLPEELPDGHWSLTDAELNQEYHITFNPQNQTVVLVYNGVMLPTDVPEGNIRIYPLEEPATEVTSGTTEEEVTDDNGDDQPTTPTGDGTD